MQQQQQPKFSLFQQIALMRALSLYPALTVMIFLRRSMGYRILNPLHLLGMMIVTVVVSTVAERSRNPELLRIFAALVLLGGLCERFKRWREYRKGVQQHSYYVGDSILEFKWLPAFIRRRRRVARFLDPLACFLVGLAAVGLSPALGKWLMFSAVCLRIFEDTVYHRQKDRALDTIDGMVASKIQAETVEHFSKSAQHAHTQNSPGIPTGVGPDIQGKIEQRLRQERQRRSPLED
jgi:hypothetical protein